MMADKVKVGALFPPAGPAKAPTPPKEPEPEPAPVKTGIKPMFAATPKAAPPVAGKPVVVALPGMFVRKRPDMTIGALRTFNLDVADDEALQQALDEILHSDPESMTMEVALDFGVAEQRLFAAASEKMLALSMDPVLTDVVAKLQSISADIRKTSVEPSALAKLWESLSGDRETEITRIERVAQTAVATNEQMAALPFLRTQASQLVVDLARILKKLQTKLAVGRWLAVTISKKEVAAVIDGRVQSISVSRLSLLQAQQQVKVLDGRMIHLTTVVHSTLVVMVPQWHSYCLSLFSDRKPTTTENFKAKILEVLDAVK